MSCIIGIAETNATCLFFAIWNDHFFHLQHIVLFDIHQIAVKYFEGVRNIFDFRECPINRFVTEMIYRIRLVIIFTITIKLTINMNRFKIDDFGVAINDHITINVVNFNRAEGVFTMFGNMEFDKPNKLGSRFVIDCLIHCV